MTNFNPVLYPVTAIKDITISSGQTASSVVDMQDLAMVGIIIPVAFTGTAITFNGSPDDINYWPLYNTAGTLLSITVAPDRWIMYTPGDFCGVRYISFVSNATEGGTRNLQVIVRSLM